MRILALAALLGVCLSSCVSKDGSGVLPGAGISAAEAADNYQWFRKHYFDADLTGKLNQEPKLH